MANRKSQKKEGDSASGRPGPDIPSMHEMSDELGDRLKEHRFRYSLRRPDYLLFMFIREFNVAAAEDALAAVPSLATALDEQTGGTALHVAAAYDCREIVRLLVNTGRCDYLAEDDAGRTPAAVARRLGADPVISRLLARKEAQQRRNQSPPKS